jgi:hypothetical protein
MNSTVYIIGALVVAALVYLATPHAKDSKRNNFAQNLQFVFTSLAIFLAGYWYFVERRGFPHANLSQRVLVLPLADGLVAVEAHVSLQNLGTTMFRVESAVVRLQAVEPTTYNYADLAALSGQDYWNAERPNPGPRRSNQFQDGELRWPVLNQYTRPVTHDVEAGETDLMVFTFVLRCPSHRYVRVSTDVINPGHEDPRAWKARSFVDLNSACPQGEGART